MGDRVAEKRFSGLNPKAVRSGLVAARAINWGNDPYARGACSYATPRTRAAQAVLRQAAGAVFFSGRGAV